MIQYKPTKSALGMLEIAFFRLFPPLSIVGAAAIGELTFMGGHAYYFFLVLPIIDTVRCMMYWNKTYENDSKNKQYWNRFYYGLKALANIIASTFIILANTFGIDALLVPGQALFISSVVGATAIQYLIKSLGFLKSEQMTPEKAEQRPFKNALLAVTLFAVCAGLGLLYFFPEMKISHEPIGWFILIMANMLPVVGFGLYHRDKWLLAAGGLLLTGLALLLVAPKLSAGFDAHFHTEIGVGLAFALVGFVVSMVHDALQWHNTHKKLMPDSQTTPKISTPKNYVPNSIENNNNAQPANTSAYSRLWRACIPCGKESIQPKLSL